jgi:hypothetical protein
MALIVSGLSCIVLNIGPHLRTTWRGSYSDRSFVTGRLA